MEECFVGETSGLDLYGAHPAFLLESTSINLPLGGR